MLFGAGMDSAGVVRAIRRLEVLTADRLCEGGGATPAKTICQSLAEARRVEHVRIVAHLAIEQSYEKHVFGALCNRYGLSTFRRKGQRKTSFMLEGPEAFVNDVFLPLFKTICNVVGGEVNQLSAAIVSDLASDTSSSPL
jgi:hypothetical protein